MSATLGNRWWALWPSLFYATSAALVLYSRCGWQIITLVPAVLLVAASLRFYRRARRENVGETAGETVNESSKARPTVRHQLWRAASIGAACAIVLYTYNGGRAILLFLPLFWILQWLGARRERAVARDALVSLGAFGLVAAPMLVYGATHFAEWNGRASALMGGDRSAALYWNNLVQSLGYFNFSAHGDDFYTDFAVLNGPMRALWIAGALYALYRWRRLWPELLLFGFLLLPGVATTPSFHRAIGTLPLVYLFVALLVAEIVKWARQRSSRWPRGVALATIVGLALWQARSDWRTLYVEQKPFAWGFYPDATVVGRYLSANTAPHPVVYAVNWPQDALRFLARSGAHPRVANADFKNYQNYNTASGDGLPEIESDLQSGQIARPATFIVDWQKLAEFERTIQTRYSTQVAARLNGRDGREIARVIVVR